jgi:DNA-binding transcriptional MerR regulator
MDRIQLFRRAGLSLDSIELLLESESSELSSTLERRLFAINKEIEKLHDQQKVILKILENEILEKSARDMTKNVWISILKAAGLDEAGMKNWHIEFEKSSPAAHQEFLESIGIAKTEIAAIRDWSRADC